MIQPKEIIVNGVSLAEIIRLHRLWLNGDPLGKRANFIGANLNRADLSNTDLGGANLNRADLSGANLSGAIGLMTAREWIAKLEHDDLGVIVYKHIGHTTYDLPDYWKIESGSFIEEVVNPLPTCDCACGVNFGTRKWCEKNYTDGELWRCRIRWVDLADVVVPYNTDGKARCGRLELLEEL